MPSRTLVTTLGLATLVALVGTGRRLVRRSLPRLDGWGVVPGLVGRVEVLRDPWGVPHVYAGSAADLFFAQGYVHAQDRLWQMEMSRRTAWGTLSEVFGARTLEVDRFLRRLGLGEVVRASLGLHGGEARAALEAYCAGINACIAERRFRLPMEFLLTGARPKPWDAADVLAVGLLTALGLSTNWDTELARWWLVHRLGPDTLARIEPTPGYGDLAAPGEKDGPPLDLGPSLREAAPWVGLSLSGGGSNAWAVRGERSASGRPLLACDPHLRVQLPSPFYEVHLCGGPYHVAGASLPGLPGVFIGHNERIAWGVTASLVDVQDLYLEEISSDGTRARWGDGWEATRVRHESIHVRGLGEPCRETVIETRHGPVIATWTHEGRRWGVALRSNVLVPSRTLEAMLGLMRATDWESFRRALAEWSAPSLSVVYADVEGNIGYQMVGRVPRRARGLGLVPAPGWDGSHEWVGDVPYDELPRALNPPRGYVVSANHRMVDDAYPHFLGLDWADPFRARRIEALIEQQPRHTVESFRTMQGDLVSVPGQELARSLARARHEDPLVRQALDALRRWDGRLDAESVGGAVYEVLRVCLLRRLLRSLADEDAVEALLGRGRHPLVRSSSYTYRATGALLRGLAQHGTPLHGGERGDETLREALEAAVAELRSRLGDDPRRWRWGRLHRVTFAHSLGMVPALGRLLNRGPYPVGGDVDTVWQTGSDAEGAYAVNAWVPSYRQVIDLANFDRSLAAVSTGQSEQVGSPHYDDLIPLWRRCELHPMPFSRAAVERYAVNRLVLEPARASAVRAVG